MPLANPNYSHTLALSLAMERIWIVMNRWAGHPYPPYQIGAGAHEPLASLLHQVQPGVALDDPSHRFRAQWQEHMQHLRMMELTARVVRQQDDAGNVWYVIETREMTKAEKLVQFFRTVFAPKTPIPD